MLPEGDLLRDFYTDLSVGDILRRARLRSNKSLEDIEFAIKISKEHLIAIEEGRLESLPGRIYALGFVRSYASYVGLDSDKIMLLLKRQTFKQLAPPSISQVENQIGDDPTIPNIKTFLIIITILIVLSYNKNGIIDYFSDISPINNNNFSQIPPLPDDLKKQITLIAKPVIKPLSQAEIAAQNVKVVPIEEVESQSINNRAILLRAIDNVWLEIRDINGKTIFSRVLQVGEEYWIPPDQDGLVMTLGNAGGLQIFINGEALPILGSKSKVLRNVSLNFESLKLRFKK